MGHGCHDPCWLPPPVPCNQEGIRATSSHPNRNGLYPFQHSICLHRKCGPYKYTCSCRLHQDPLRCRYRDRSLPCADLHGRRFNDRLRSTHCKPQDTPSWSCSTAGYLHSSPGSPSPFLHSWNQLRPCCCRIHRNHRWR